MGHLKWDLDQRIDSNDRAMLQLDDLQDLSISVCDGILAKLKELAELERELPDLIAAADGHRFETHMKRWRTVNATVMRGYAALQHAATGEAPSGMEAIMSNSETLNPALETLELQIRTAERIKNELGR